MPEGTNPDPNTYTFTVQNSGGDTLVGTVSVSASWVSVSSTAFSLLVGTSSQIAVSTNTSGLAPGYHEATISPTSNGGSASGKVEARIPHLTLLADSIGYDFGTVETGNNPDTNAYSFMVQNSGSGILTGSISESAAWLSVTPTSFSLDSSQTQQITVTANTSGLSPGNYVDMISIVANGGNDSGYVYVNVIPPLAVAPGTEIPDRYALGQNFPNPFNPVTTIRYQLPEPGFIELSVFNISGRMVVTLASGFQQAGYYAVQWNASLVPSGVYLYRIIARDYRAVRKCIVLK